MTEVKVTCKWCGWPYEGEGHTKGACPWPTKKSPESLMPELLKQAKRIGDMLEAVVENMIEPRVEIRRDHLVGSTDPEIIQALSEKYRDMYPELKVFAGDGVGGEAKRVFARRTGQEIDPEEVTCLVCGGPCTDRISSTVCSVCCDYGKYPVRPEHGGEEAAISGAREALSRVRKTLATPVCGILDLHIREEIERELHGAYVLLSGGLPWACDVCGEPGWKSNGPEGYCDKHKTGKCESHFNGIACVRKRESAEDWTDVGCYVCEPAIVAGLVTRQESLTSQLEELD